MTTASATKPATTRRSSQGQAPVGSSLSRSCSIDSPHRARLQIESSAAAPPNGGLPTRPASAGDGPCGTVEPIPTLPVARTLSSSVVPLPCHSQESRPVLSGPHGQCQAGCDLRRLSSTQVVIFPDLALQAGCQRELSRPSNRTALRAFPRPLRVVWRQSAGNWALEWAAQTRLCWWA